MFETRCWNREDGLVEKQIRDNGEAGVALLQADEIGRQGTSSFKGVS
jgi:hypothetical protein